MTNNTYKMKPIIYIILIFTLLSCENKTQDSVSTTSKLEDTPKVEKSKDILYSNSTNKVAINFKKTKIYLTSFYSYLIVLLRIGNGE